MYLSIYLLLLLCLHMKLFLHPYISMLVQLFIDLHIVFKQRVWIYNAGPHWSSNKQITFQGCTKSFFFFLKIFFATYLTSHAFKWLCVQNDNTNSIIMFSTYDRKPQDCESFGLICWLLIIYDLYWIIWLPTCLPFRGCLYQHEHLHKSNTKWFDFNRTTCLTLRVKSWTITVNCLLSAPVLRG